MPFLRFSSDERGYENTYLCHTYRRGGQPRLRVLYWFRTPPGIKVGRLALDPEAIRAIEESNPDLKFNWGEILKVKPSQPQSDYGRDGREGRRVRRRRSRDTGAASDSAKPDTTSASRQVATPELMVSVESEAE